MQPKKHEKKSEVHLCVKQKLELTKMPQSCVRICMEYDMKQQTVWDNTKKKSDHQKYYLLTEEVLPIMQKAAQWNTQSHQNK